MWLDLTERYACANALFTYTKMRRVTETSSKEEAEVEGEIDYTIPCSLFWMVIVQNSVRDDAK